ncbi:hypothetical protein [Armatimonas rosea]|uniref:Uncharacterized protein n=1 Tax=Armatimonas rosea TaxID=685828 RepID=A0A7W9SRC3_ARMRO|nr:hypothetical protein [Armatimonas rosea]MBB6051025.1 hypothetical protein [Armatimonas rosea]
MLYRCRKCEQVEAFGCLPAVSCGMYLMVLLGISVGSFSVALQVVAHAARRVAHAARRVAHSATPPHLPWWVMPVGFVIGIPLVVLGAYLWGRFLELMEYLFVALHRCPNCKARRWSWGFTSGFGL